MTAPNQKPADAAMRRRSLLTSLAAAVPAVALAQGGVGSAQPPTAAPAATVAVAVDPCQFLNSQERRALEAMAARILPDDELGPGAVEAGAVIFIDRQLAGAWGPVPISINPVRLSAAHRSRAISFRLPRRNCSAKVLRNWMLPQPNSTVIHSPT
jgi:Gluconate 2-dehydrogenase subunit 3